MIVVGIDDTDVIGSRGTNQLARQIVRELPPQWSCVRIVRHQLLDDPRVPYTSKNGSASISLERQRNSPRSPDVAESTMPSLDDASIVQVLDCCRDVMRRWFVDGSDPGLGLLAAAECPDAVLQWGRRCQRELVTRDGAWTIAADAGVHLEALGGTEDGIIGALAAIGLAATENDGRIVQLGEWPDDFGGRQTINSLADRGVHVRELHTNRKIVSGTVDVGKRLRPNLRDGHAVLFVESTPAAAEYRAVKLP